jgi:hypothetical protein
MPRGSARTWFKRSEPLVLIEDIWLVLAARSGIFDLLLAWAIG